MTNVVARLTIAVIMSAFTLSACGSDVVIAGSTSANTASGGMDGSGGSGGSMVGLPPGPPDDAGPGPGDGSDVVFVVSNLFVGENNTWQTLGFNIDGKVSTKDATDLCTPNAGGAKSAVYQDGDNGIDNSWGKNLTPLWEQLGAYSIETNSAISKGVSYLLKLTKLGASANYNSLEGKWYLSHELAGGAAPTWGDNDAWKVAVESLSTPRDVESSKIVFPTAYVNDNTWVSGPGGDVVLRLHVGEGFVPLQIQKAMISMQLTNDHAAAASGIISGMIDTEAFIEQFRQHAGYMDVGLCDGGLFDTLADTIRQASDIMADGTQDPNKSCNGISIGIGFEAKRIEIGGISPPQPVLPDPCAN